MQLNKRLSLILRIFLFPGQLLADGSSLLWEHSICTAVLQCTSPLCLFLECTSNALQRYDYMHGFISPINAVWLNTPNSCPHRKHGTKCVPFCELKPLSTLYKLLIVASLFCCTFESRSTLICYYCINTVTETKICSPPKSFGRRE